MATELDNMELSDVKIEESCERTVTARVSGLPDMPDFYASRPTTFRPTQLVIKYTADNNEPWELNRLTVFGPNVKKDRTLGVKRCYATYWRLDLDSLPDELQSKVLEFIPTRDA
jgi:hypothetical protein